LFPQYKNIGLKMEELTAVEKILSRSYPYKIQALIAAASFGHEDKVDFLILEGVDKNE
jgi:hypothetical protein